MEPEPDDHDYPAAASYLSLAPGRPDAGDAVVTELRGAPISHWKAKDLLRASGLSLLPTDNLHVASDLKKINKGVSLSPVLLVEGGHDQRGAPLISRTATTASVPATTSTRMPTSRAGSRSGPPSEPSDRSSDVYLTDDIFVVCCAKSALQIAGRGQEGREWPTSKP